MSPKFAFFDTNTWIYLANGFEAFDNKYGELHFKVFDVLEKRVLDGSLVIFTNEIIKEEWARHLDDAAHQVGLIKADAKKYQGDLETIASFINKDQEEVARIKSSIEQEMASRIARHEKHIERVKKFIEERTDIIAVTDAHRVEASQMAQKKQAPFKGKKSNSMSDALIVLSITDYLDKTKACDHAGVQYARHVDREVDSYFVSSNFNDFAALPRKNIIHPDLAPILDRSGTVYYPTLGILINKLEKEFLTQDELKAIEEADHAIYCSVCDSEYPTVEISKPVKLFDPFKLDETNDPAQLAIFEELAPVIKVPYSEVETAYCESCGADFITCPNCGDMMHIKENEITACTGCEYKFLLNVEKDRKGAIHSYEFSIIQTYTCNDCGEDFEEVDENGLCEVCAEYRKIAEEN